MYFSSRFLPFFLLVSALILGVACDGSSELTVQAPKAKSEGGEADTVSGETGGDFNGIYRLTGIEGEIQDAVYSREFDKMVLVADQAWILSGGRELTAVETEGPPCAASIYEHRAAISYEGGVALVLLRNGAVIDEFPTTDKGCPKVALGESSVFLSFKVYSSSAVLVQLDSEGEEVARDPVHSGLRHIAVQPGGWGGELYATTDNSSANLIHFLSDEEGIVNDSFEANAGQNTEPGSRFWFSADGEQILTKRGPIFLANEYVPELDEESQVFFRTAPNRLFHHRQLELDYGDDLSFTDTEIPGEGVASLCQIEDMVATIAGPKYGRVHDPDHPEKHHRRVHFFSYPDIEELGKKDLPDFRIDDEVPIPALGRYIFCKSDGQSVYVLLEDRESSWGVLTIAVPKS